MARIKTDDLRKMTEQERTKKLEDLKFELIKSKVSSSKAGTKPREIRKAIARILTLKKQHGDMSKMRPA